MLQLASWLSERPSAQAHRRTGTDKTDEMLFHSHKILFFTSLHSLVLARTRSALVSISGSRSSGSSSSSPAKAPLQARDLDEICTTKELDSKFEACALWWPLLLALGRQCCDVIAAYGPTDMRARLCAPTETEFRNGTESGWLASDRAHW